jgi:glycosyltransferase involved in cell wall biosynthesis
MKKLLFVITQLYKGGAETALVNLLSRISPEDYVIDLIILNQYPVKDAVSLIPMLPENINVFDQWKKTFHIPIFYKIKRKLHYILQNEFEHPSKAIQYVKEKNYDWAFHIGEWSSPKFVANYVRAKNKAAWIHTDLSRLNNFESADFFSYDNKINYYIFVSKNSLDASVAIFPQLKEKSIVINNIVNDRFIKSQSNEFLPFSESLPVIVTCANIRPEKNHIRQIEVMAKLRDRGVRIKWLNLGSTADEGLYRKLLIEIEKKNLSQDFMFLGAVNNPYPYIKNASAVAVLSDYESWSMVITEAKILGVPVIATKTSGALEQLEHEVTGILCEFDSNDIADKMESFLRDKELQKKIRDNITGFDSSTVVLFSFNQLIKNGFNRKTS